jgi:serine/threonine-protein kinase RsbW
MQVELSLVLPRDTSSVPRTRHLLVAILKSIPVPAPEWQDLALALTEACANVVRHAGNGDDYRVATRIRPDGCCEIDVIDYGEGFDPDTSAGLPDPESERGRGLALIGALTDCVRMDSRPRSGTLVHFEKQLTLPEAAVTSATSQGGLRRTL